MLTLTHCVGIKLSSCVVLTRLIDAISTIGPSLSHCIQLCGTHQRFLSFPNKATRPEPRRIPGSPTAGGCQAPKAERERLERSARTGLVALPQKAPASWPWRPVRGPWKARTGPGADRLERRSRNRQATAQRASWPWPRPGRPRSAFRPENRQPRGPGAWQPLVPTQRQRPAGGNLRAS